MARLAGALALTALLAGCVRGHAGALGSITATISEQVPTVVTVSWDGSIAAGDTFVEYGLDSALDLVTPTGTGASATLLGLKAGRTYSFRGVTVTADGERLESATSSVDLAPPPEGLPAFGITEYDPSQAAEGGFLLTSVLMAGDSYAAIIDRDGDYVWYLPSTDELGISSTHLSYDGHGVVFAQNDRDQATALGSIVSASLDGTHYQLTAASLSHHDVVELPGGDLAYIGLDTREDIPFEEGGTATVTSDTIGESPAGATSDDQARIVYAILDDYPHTLWDICRHSEVEAYDTGGVDWSHSNSLMYYEPDDAFLLVSKNLDAIIKVDRASGQQVWQLGGRYSDFTDVDGDTLPDGDWANVDGPNSTWWSHGHMSDWWDGGFVMFDNGYHHDPAQSRAVEYSYDEAAHTVKKVWEYWAPDLYFNPLLGDVRKMPNGNYMVSWANQGMLTEITPAQEVVWRASATLGAGTSRVHYIPDIYDPLK